MILAITTVKKTL